MELLAGFSAILSTLAVIGIFRPFKFAPKLTRRHYATAAVVAFGVFLFSAPTPPPSAPEEKRSASEGVPKDENTFADTGKQIAWNERGQDTVRSKLRDPDSAEFRNVQFYSGGPSPTTCGEVNAKNGFGGFSGYERFIAVGSTMSVLESEMKPNEMDKLWESVCIKAASDGA